MTPSVPTARVAAALVGGVTAWTLGSCYTYDVSRCVVLYLIISCVLWCGVVGWGGAPWPMLQPGPRGSGGKGTGRPSFFAHVAWGMGQHAPVCSLAGYWSHHANRHKC